MDPTWLMDDKFLPKYDILFMVLSLSGYYAQLLLTFVSVINWFWRNNIAQILVLGNSILYLRNDNNFDVLQNLDAISILNYLTVSVPER